MAGLARPVGRNGSVCIDEVTEIDDPDCLRCWSRETKVCDAQTVGLPMMASESSDRGASDRCVSSPLRFRNRTGLSGVQSYSEDKMCKLSKFLFFFPVEQKISQNSST
jgi:hypothetical protein